MVKVQLKHTIHRYCYGGKHYYPGDILEVDEKAVTAYMVVLPAPAPSNAAVPESEAVVKPKRRRKTT